jgi:uridine phosphorylase
MISERDPNVFTRILYGCEANEIAEVVLLTPMDSTLEALKLKAEDVKEFKGFNHGFSGTHGGKKVSVFNSRIGSPVASDCVYYLRFTSCRSVIYTGLIGSLQPSIRIGDVIVPIAALRGEGASKYFIDGAYPAVADFSLLKTLSTTLEEAYADLDVNIHYGPIYTTDSFAAETEEFLELWRSRNLLGIEMETSAIYTIASLYGIKAASVHIVSDNPVVKKSFFDPLSEEDEERRRVCTELLIDALVKLVDRI